MRWSRLFLLSAAAISPRLEGSIPDKLVVLTFDDSAKSHATFVAPLLKKLGFGATFFITEGFDFPTNKAAYMTWEEIAGLHRMGFEIGNHTAKHANAAEQTGRRSPPTWRSSSPVPGERHPQAGELRLSRQRHRRRRHRGLEGERLSVRSARRRSGVPV